MNKKMILIAFLTANITIACYAMDETITIEIEDEKPTPPPAPAAPVVPAIPVQPATAAPTIPAQPGAPISAPQISTPTPAPLPTQQPLSTTQPSAIPTPSTLPASTVPTTPPTPATKNATSTSAKKAPAPIEQPKLAVETETLLHAKVISTASLDVNTYTPQGFVAGSSREALTVQHRQVSNGSTPWHIFVKFKQTDDQQKKWAIQAAQAVGDNCTQLFGAATPTVATPTAPAPATSAQTSNDVRTIAEFKVISTQETFNQDMVQQYLQKAAIIGNPVTLPNRPGTCYVIGLFDAKATNEEKKEAGKQVFFAAADNLDDVVKGLPLLRPAA